MKLERFERYHFFRSAYYHITEMILNDKKLTEGSPELELLSREDPFRGTEALSDEFIDLLSSFCKEDSRILKELKLIKNKKRAPILSKLPLLLESEEAFDFYKALFKRLGIDLLEENEEYQEVELENILICVGLKTHYIKKRTMRFYQRKLALASHKLIFLNLTSTEGLFQGALKRKGIDIFDVFVYSSDKEEKDIRESFTDLKKDLLYPEKSLTKRPKSHIIPALICSAILWGIVTASLLQIFIPLTFGGFFLATLPAILYSVFKFILFSLSAKR